MVSLGVEAILANDKFSTFIKQGRISQFKLKSLFYQSEPAQNVVGF